MSDRLVHRCGGTFDADHRYCPRCGEAVFQGRLTRDQLVRIFPVFVCHALDVLAGERCCPVCCAPCSALSTLVSMRALDWAVSQAHESLYEDSIWWVDGTVDQDWLRSRWDTGCAGSHVKVVP
jgi:ribosomal protein S27AE